MPVQTSYPGVYIQELPSGTRTITGVATSITAFVGRAARGPLDTAVTIVSQSDYDREFGGLDPNSPMSFAVADFFANGGSTAVIVRLFTALPSTIVTATIPIAGFNLIAANPGSWGANLSVTIDSNVAAATLTAMGRAIGEVFNVTVTDSGTKSTEIHRNVTLYESTRRIDRVLAAESDLVLWPPTAATKFVTTTSLDPTTFAAAGIPWPAPPTLSIPQTVVSGAATKPVDGTYLDHPTIVTDPTSKTGLYALEQVDLFNILVLPPTLQSAVDPSQTDGDLDIANNVPPPPPPVVPVTNVLAAAAAYCTQRRAILLLDSPEEWTVGSSTTLISNITQTGLTALLGPVATNTSNVAIFFPRIEYANPFNDGRIEPFIASGAIAGIMAATDSSRGVWKAPAGLDAMITGVSQLSYNLTDLENGQLNQLGINCIRNKPGVPAPVVWGSRTSEGDDRLQSQWKYLPVRRMALFLEESLFQGMQWVVFEPNDEPLWAQIRTNVTAFMQGLFMQGAFQGQTPDDAYFVKCDDETTTQTDIDGGIVNVIVGFAPLKPAEFVVISLQQMAGQTGT